MSAGSLPTLVQETAVHLNSAKADHQLTTTSASGPGIDSASRLRRPTGQLTGAATAEGCIINIVYTAPVQITARRQRA